VALLAGVLTGCSESSGKDGGAAANTSAPTKEAAAGKAGTAASGGTIGAGGTACEQLPVSFDIAKKWEAEAIDAEAALDKVPSPDPDSLEDDISQEVLDLILRQGPVTAACEVDAKPAGHIGFLRVWTGEPGEDDARTVLEEFLAAEKGVSKEKYRTFTNGEVKGVEVEYLTESALLEETKKQRALAVTTGDGPVVIGLGGLDSEEHTQMIPAYELAKRTLRTT
jgi:hypothetical protein